MNLEEQESILVDCKWAHDGGCEWYSFNSVQECPFTYIPKCYSGEVSW